MVSTANLILGALAIVLGVAWVVRPMTMIRWQNRILFQWRSEEPDVGNVSEPLARVGGLVLALAGVVLIAGIRF